MTEKKDTPQEIDLLELFSNIGNWIGEKIVWAYKIGLHIFYFFVRNSPWFAIFLIAGYGFGYFKVRTTPPYYRTEMVGFSNSLPNAEVVKTINNWDYSKIFRPDVLKSIRKIGATFVLDLNKDGIWDEVESLETIDKYDTIASQRQYGNFCIQIEFNDTIGYQYIPKIKQEVLGYISNNERLQKMHSLRLQQIKELIPKLQSEMDELDSLKRNEYFGKQRDKTIKFGEVLLIGEKQQTLYHNEVLALFKQKQDLERTLILTNDPLEIVLDFSVPTKAKDKVTERMTGKYTKMFFILGFLIILVIDQRKFIFGQFRRAKQDHEELS